MNDKALCGSQELGCSLEFHYPFGHVKTLREDVERIITCNMDLRVEHKEKPIDMWIGRLLLASQARYPHTMFYARISARRLRLSLDLA